MYIPLDRCLLLAEEFPGDATADVTGTDNAAAAVITAVDSIVTMDFFRMSPPKENNCNEVLARESLPIRDAVNCNADRFSTEKTPPRIRVCDPDR
jgi:uncharacterized protein (DUF2126 family)